MICSICGRTLLPSATFCPGCKGKPQTAAETGMRPSILPSSTTASSQTQRSAGKVTLFVLGGIAVFVILLLVGAIILGSQR